MDNSLSLDSINGQQGKLKYYSTSINMDAEETGYMDFDSYLKVLASQMSNQDFNDPMSDAEFMQQMASYSMMEAIGQMNQQSQISYATSLVGKAVTVGDGSSSETGIVESVVIGEKGCSLLVNGKKYAPNEVTDVVDIDTYHMSREMIGKTASVKENEQIIDSGKITDFLFKDGEAYAVIGKNYYELDKLVFETENEGGTEYLSADVAPSEAAARFVDFGDEVSLSFDEEIPITVYPTSTGSTTSGWGAETGTPISNAYTASETEAAPAHTLHQTDSDVTINGVVYENLYDPAALAAQEAENEAASENVQPTAQTVSDTDYRTASVAAMTSSVANSSEEEGILYAAEIVTADADFVTGELKGIAQGNNFATGEVGITYGSNWRYGDDYDPHYNPNRAFANEYPELAQIADEYGSKMFDIRYITNNLVTSRLRKGVVGTTYDGRGFTEIGFSGKGQLGEVVTWDDGTQRVEVISEHGSTWYMTSGKYTLDQICDLSKNFSIRDLTPYELVIRAASVEYTPREQAVLESYSDLYFQKAREYWSENPPVLTGYDTDGTLDPEIK